MEVGDKARILSGWLKGEEVLIIEKEVITVPIYESLNPTVERYKCSPRNWSIWKNFIIGPGYNLEPIEKWRRASFLGEQAYVWREDDNSPWALGVKGLIVVDDESRGLICIMDQDRKMFWVYPESCQI